MTYNLNVQQEKALLEVDRPVLILAGAGSGKTRIVTSKIAYLIKDCGFYPNNILAVTFTNKAAKEMKNRVLDLISDNNIDNKYLWINTFHSICAKILRRDIHHINYENSFSIYDSSDQNLLVKEIIQKYRLDNPAEKIQQITSYISKIKNSGQNFEYFIENAKSDGNIFAEQMGYIYKYYEKELFKNNALDFDDLILKTIKLFENNKDIIESYRNRFRYILVDEFQDTNHSQYRLIKLLAKGKSSISVVGDDDQSIYSWRGAEISNIINFSKDFKNCLTVKLEQNYRSTNTILNAAHSVVKKNEKRLDKKLWSENKTGDKIYYFSAVDDRSESFWIKNKIKQLFSSSLNLCDIAILYRMNHQSRIIEDALRRENLPYKIFGNIEFYDRMEIKDLISYLALFSNNSDALAFKRVMQVPKKGIGKTTIEKIEEISINKSYSFIDAVSYCISNNIIRNPAKNRLNDLIKWIMEVKNHLDEISITKLLDDILQYTNYISYIENNFDNYEDRLDNIQEFKRAIKEYELENENPKLDSFLTELSLQSSNNDNANSSDYISLMTLHNSKGLEFDTVFVTGLNEGLFPHYRSMNNLKELEEERRLFYVALTRAKQKCFLSSSSKQMQFGQLRFYNSSNFINEIDDEYIEKEYEESYESNDSDSTNNINYSFSNNKQEITTSVDETQNITVKQKVYHKNFGEGVVKEIYTNANMPTALIIFKDKSRILVLKYANLTVKKV